MTSTHYRKSRGKRNLQGNTDADFKVGLQNGPLEHRKQKIQQTCQSICNYKNFRRNEVRIKIKNKIETINIKGLRQSSLLQMYNWINCTDYITNKPGTDEGNKITELNFRLAFSRLISKKHN